MNENVEVKEKEIAQSPIGPEETLVKVQRVKREVSVQEQKLREENKALKKELEVARAEIENLFTKGKRASEYISKQEKDLQKFFEEKQNSEKKLREVIDLLSKLVSGVEFSLELGRGAINNVLKSVPTPTSKQQEGK